MNKLLEKTGSRLCSHASTLAGELQRALNLPITYVGTHRQAVEQCKQRLSLQIPVRGRVAISALRNRSWIGLAVYMACVLRQMGYESTLLYRKSEIERLFPTGFKHFNFWEGVATIPGIELKDLESVEVSPEEMDEFSATASLSSASAVAYDLHLEEDDVRTGDSSMREKNEAMLQHMKRMGASAKKLLSGGGYHRFILYSGLISESPLLLAAARRLSLTTHCLEGWAWRNGHLISNKNAPALDYDVEGWLKRIEPWDQAKDAEINRYINFLDGRYEGGSDWLDNFYSVQRAQISKSLPPDLRRFVTGGGDIFLATPNVIGDSSMLQRETIFPSQCKWICALIDYFRIHPQIKLIVRAHPAEVWVKSKVRIKMADIAREHAAGAANIHVIDAEQKLNTFTLLPFVSAGLVWLSSAGVDMVVRGIPVLAAARPKYTGMGIVEEPKTQSNYFQLLESWSGSRFVRPTEDQIRAAKKYLYIVFKGFSSEAWSRNSYITGCRLNEMPNQAEHDSFYQELIS